MSNQENVDKALPKGVSPYAKKSFRNLGITFLLLFVGMLSLHVLNNGSTGIATLMIPILICFILSILGFIYGVKSVRRTEKSKWMKYIGLVGNLMLTLMFFSMLLYYLVIWLIFPVCQ